MERNVIDLKLEVRKIRRAAAWSAGFCLLSAVAGYWLVSRVMSIPEGLAARMAFVLRADLFLIVWVILGIGLVSRGRRRSAADINGAAYAPPSPAIAIHVAFLQNTLEQTIAAVFVHLALSTLIAGPWLALIPVAVFLFSVGRITFLRGYPQGAGARAFGMVTTALPTIIGLVAALVLMVFRLTSSA